MKAEVIGRSAAVLLGIVAGYVVWLAGITALTVVVPTQYMIAAAGVLLGVIVLISLALARHFRQSDRLCCARLLVRAGAAHRSHCLGCDLSELTREGCQR
jgi:hypothetical protein